MTVPSQVAFRNAKGFEVMLKYIAANQPPKVRERAAYVIGAACSGNRRMQQVRTW